MGKSNYLYLGVASACITLAIIQMTIPDVLSMSLYAHIAWAAFGLTLLECVKSILYRSKINMQKKMRLAEEEYHICNRSADVFMDYRSLDEECEYNQERKSALLARMDTLKNDKKLGQTALLIHLFTALQLILCFVLFSLAYIHIIPDDFYTIKSLCIPVLLSFALLMLSFFISRTNDETEMEADDMANMSRFMNDYYLDLLERISKERKKTKEKT